MNVRDVMSTKIYTAKPDTTVQEIWKLLFTKHKNAIPVVDESHTLVGIITKEDLLKALYPNYEQYFEDIPSFENFEAMENKVLESRNIKARHIMCKKVIYTRNETPVMRALSRMIVRRLNQLPVLSDANEVIGMITKGDIFSALFKKQFLSPAQKRKVKSKQ
jgi:CBS-domain-containing membrane protein